MTRPHGEVNDLTGGIIGLGPSGQDLVLKCTAVFRASQVRHQAHIKAGGVDD